MHGTLKKYVTPMILCLMQHPRMDGQWDERKITNFVPCLSRNFGGQSRDDFMSSSHVIVSKSTFCSLSDSLKDSPARTRYFGFLLSKSRFRKQGVVEPNQPPLAHPVVIDKSNTFVVEGILQTYTTT